MTTAQHRIHAELETQRFIASQASRAATLAALRANALERAGELALMARFQESRRVLELNYFVAED